MMLSYTEEEFSEAFTRSEIASMPKDEASKEFVILHDCENCNKKYFCPSVNYPADSKCKCKNNCGFICWNFPEGIE